ncbi:MAG: shikimate kinase [Actinomycetaceae bacterium]|nr:shikimate kinase [Actinomycetaceae bacterium]MDY6083164.1 shikimate kinase [Actinomycetaceae bacterium]
MESHEQASQGQALEHHGSQLIVLVGAPGSDTDKIGARLSEVLHRDWLFTDDVIQHLVGMSIEDVDVTEHGLTRTLEHDATQAVLSDVDAMQERIVVLGSASLGQSVNDSDFADIQARVRALGQAGAYVIYCWAHAEELIKRSGIAGPRLAAVFPPRKILRSQFPERDALYRSVATHDVNIVGKSVDECTTEIQRLIA